MDKIIYFAKVENNFLKKVLFINIFDKKLSQIEE